MDKKIYGFVYLIWNMINGKKYVGQTTKTVKKRFNQHACLNKYPIGMAIYKYGRKKFRYGIIKTCYSKEELNYWEKFYIAALRSKCPTGYNRTDGGEGTSGNFCTDETRKKKSAAVMGEKNPFWGKHHTEESRKIISKSRIGNKSWTGRHYTAKENAKISASKRGETPYKNLLAEMDKRNLSYNALAKLLTLNHETVSSKMRGEQNFTEHQIDKLVEIFGLPAEYLIQRTDGLSAITSRDELGAKSSAAQRLYSPYKNLLCEMDKQQMSYTRLAKLLDSSRKRVSNKMRGIHGFTEADWKKLSEIFNLPAEYLMVREDGLSSITSKAAWNTKLSIAHRADSPYKNLLYEMDKQQMTYSTLAQLLSLCHQSVSLKMLGKRNFTARDVEKLVEIFGKPADYLMARDDA